ncbi:helix-turn-helix domain-containing protein [Peribacillus asahii]|nr:hypothetical protein LIT35_23900 [Peribacillus asahii]
MRTQTAKSLGISLRSLYYKMEKAKLCKFLHAFFCTNYANFCI